MARLQPGKCKDCKFFHPNEEGIRNPDMAGQCRLYPPRSGDIPIDMVDRSVNTPTLGNQWRWPWVSEKDWCGQFNKATETYD